MSPEQQQLLALLQRRPQASQAGDFLVVDNSLPAPTGSICLPVPRLHLLIEGSERIEACCNGKRVHLEVAPGTWLFTVPHGWNLLDWRTQRLSLGVVFHQGFTRFLAIMHDGKTNRRLTKQVPNLVHHSPRHAPSDIMNLLSALMHMSRFEEKRPLAMCSCLDAVLDLLERELMLTSEVPISLSQRRWQEALIYMQENVHKPIDRNSVARHFRMHPASLSRLFKTYDSESFQDRLTHFRVERSVHLLRDVRMDLGKIAVSCGFSNADYFSKVFRKVYGEAPSRYRLRFETY